MEAADLTKCTATFVGSLVESGLSHAVLSPGSRNFPLINAMVRQKQAIDLFQVVDERSAAFVALGLAQSVKKPVAICCTSGTAVLNYYPAIAEAFYSKTPLVVLTADRPPESIDNWEGQCIRQNGVFEKHILASFQTPDAYTNQEAFYDIAHKAFELAFSKRGPVHVNMPFREPFYHIQEEETAPTVQKTVVRDRFFVSVPEELKNDLCNVRKILWLNGAGNDSTIIQPADNSVVFSDVISNQPASNNHWESAVMGLGENQGLAPEILITTGQYFVSKHLRLWLKQIEGIKHWHIGDGEQIPTPFDTKPVIVPCDPNEAMALIGINNHAYVDQWKSYFERHDQALEKLTWKDFNEFSVVKDIQERIPSGSVVHASNSMPVRYLAYSGTRHDLRYFANRGTSGIDGCTSTAVGYALGTDKSVFLFTGDIAFFYDVNALWAEHVPENLKIIVMNNSGGGIFELIDGPGKFKASLDYQVTPHNRRANHVCNDLGLKYFVATNHKEYRQAIENFLNHSAPALLEVVTDRKQNKAFFEAFERINLNNE